MKQLPFKTFLRFFWINGTTDDQISALELMFASSILLNADYVLDTALGSGEMKFRTSFSLSRIHNPVREKPPKQ